MRVWPLVSLGLSLAYLVGVLPPIALRALAKPIAQNSAPLCSPPVLTRLQRYRSRPGDSLASIAAAHSLLPQTLLQLNPAIANGVKPGQEILIPPYNGIRITAPQGATWKDLEAAYGVRADVLFEVNGCQKTPTTVFLPGVTWTSTSELGVDNYTGLTAFPLDVPREVGLSYGWQTQKIQNRRLFHSGIDLVAPVGTPVLAAAPGTVIYTGPDQNYGILVIVRHSDRRQTRYAHLGRVRTAVGRTVNAGDLLGTVGTSGDRDISAAHLHFEVRYLSPVGWVAQDPLLHLGTVNIPTPPTQPLPPINP
ncbi:MAG: peptidoglycan DD-metalloendopeptidase family protein [Chloroflexaceae bacterium]|nr:peptidoglycan DD-metalloendopeptidase family protein [Chloroflexaceae bacterium]